MVILYTFQIKFIVKKFIEFNTHISLYDQKFYCSHVWSSILSDISRIKDCKNIKGEKNGKDRRIKIWNDAAGERNADDRRDLRWEQCSGDFQEVAVGRKSAL